MGGSQTTGKLETNRRKNILVIDDDLGMRESLDEVFNEDFNVFMAMNGEEGIDFLKGRRFNLVLLDLSLPGIDGIEVLKWTRGLAEPPPVMILTGHSSQERAEECADLAVIGYVQKPFDANKLFDRVTVMLKEDKKTGIIAANSKSGSAKKLSSLVEKAIRFIKGHYLDHTEPLKPKEVADHVGVSREHLLRSFKEEIECGVNEFINRLRIRKAKELLLEKKDAVISEISYGSGFENENYFIKIFKRYTGTTPTDFRESNGLLETSVRDPLGDLV
jgi:YesN/AraC family two-component response regulator